MRHIEFIRLIEARKGSIISALMRAALPPGTRFAVFVALEKSDDPAEERLAAVIANAEREGIMQLVRAYVTDGAAAHGQIQ